ncbi:MAG: hypothetical protein NTX64_09110, partial [Elusimicrobia bacterium]|nr:hypothetical protein [Elusimicrobiota bacterium]
RLSAGKAMSGGRLRCSNCRYSFRLHTGRWLGRHRVPARVWLAAVKCFELGLGHLELAQVAGLSPATADEMIYTIQLSLAAQDPVWRCAAAAALDGGPAPRAFAVKPAGRGVRVEILAGEEPGVRIPVPPGGALPPELRGFLASAKRWMSLSPARFALKLKELEIRSRATEPLFELVLDSLVRYTQTELRAPTPRRSERTAEDLVAA